ncbi:Sugar transporter [Kickxella alabastrina]|nr:Sugar transporter [Kickxella alabastrina]
MTLIPILAACANVAMSASQLSVITALRRAQNTKTTVPMLQFTLSFLSSVLWLKYGLIHQDHTIASVNFIGMFISVYILWCFWCLSIIRTHVENCFLFTTLTGVLTVGYIDHSENPVALEVFSTVCCLMPLAVLASPLSQVGNVIRLRDASVLLPSLAILAFFNNVLWATYGYLHNNPFMLVPNIIGAAFCTLQLALIAYYGRAAAQMPAAATATAITSGVAMTEIVPRPVQD